jgi:hypothetical protein
VIKNKATLTLFFGLFNRFNEISGISFRWKFDGFWLGFDNYFNGWRESPSLTRTIRFGTGRLASASAQALAGQAKL